MIIYLLKVIACSAIFIAAYYIFLQREKMLTFNRFYLLIALPLSLCVPLLTFELAAESPISDIPFMQQGLVPLPTSEKITQPQTPSTETNDLPLAGIIGYSLVCLILLIRFLGNLLGMIRRIQSAKTYQLDNAKLILLDQPVIPHTFLKFIFISKQDSENKQILTHELTHAREYHSLDVVLIELVQCLFWINPLIPFYKKAIRLNHEFIADEAVINQFPDKANYLQLLLQKVQVNSPVSLASSFSYALTKKRFLMLSTTKNAKRSAVKMVAATLIISITTLVFCSKSFSQAKPAQAVVSDSTKVTAEEILEFEVLVEQYRVKKSVTKFDNEHIMINRTNLPESERERLASIYSRMTAEQKAKYPESIFYVIAPIPMPTRQSPTVDQLTAWKDPKVYGVWLDGKRISNSELNRLTQSELGYYSVSKLLKNAAHYGKYKYHVELMTNVYFDKTYPSKSN